GRIFLSGCFRVEFRDFFIADELNSLAYSFWTLSYFFCAYSWQWTDLGTQCNIALMWYTPLIASLPPWWRLLQCLRRYKDSNEKVHLANAAKYASSILATIIGAIRRIHPGRGMDIVFILTCIFNSSYTSTWDLKMDWGLFQPDSQHLFLRDELVFKRWIYYVSAILDVCLRFSWTLNFVRMRLNGAILGFILALLEGCRRIQWNVFRLENEHLNNCGQYRAIKEIPLPFALRETVKHPNDDNDEGNIRLPPNADDYNNNRDTTMNGRATPPTPIPIGEPTTTAPIVISSPPPSPSPNHMLDSSWMSPITRQQSTRHSQAAAQDSVYSGSFYGRRDFESRHDHDDATAAKEAAGSQQPASAIGNVLTRIRSFGAAGGHDSDNSDTDREDNDEDDDDDDDDDDV
ncbi:EXS family-domain-containing protein, partial [Zychaea mexicana]|uniref:EXS family-domain-containing protein n=1 Tax=Zychaea mexicana TaxID=64656 RepID=UPI0022FF2D5A